MSEFDRSGDGALPEPRHLASPEERERLEAARLDVLRVHRALLTAERMRYESVHGPVANNSAFLQLVISDPWFDWLRPMTQLVLLIDERTMDRKQPIGRTEAQTLRARALVMVRPDAQGDAFQRLLAEAVRQTPPLGAFLRQLGIPPAELSARLEDPSTACPRGLDGCWSAS